MPARVLVVLVLLLLAGCGREDVPPPLAEAAGPPAAELLDELRAGGHVLVIRHTTTESATDQAEVVGDCGRQRNLNAQGRREARELGAAMRALQIPIGVVRMSPLCRARETAELAFGTDAQEDVDLVSPGVLGDIGDDEERAERLRELATTPPPPATNTVLVTHTGNIGDAFGLSVLEGEAVVFHPERGGAGRGEPEPVGQIGLEDWRQLAGQPG